MNRVRIMSVTADQNEIWFTDGIDRVDAERWHAEAIQSGKYHKPLYRVIARLKPQ